MRNKVFALAACLLLGSSAIAQPMSTEQIDQLVEKVRKQFDVPGAAVAITYKGKLVHQKGYGVDDIRDPQPVSTQTMFKIASDTKAFTTAALALLVQQGKVAWDAPVKEYLKDFQMYDPWVTERFTLVDLLTHRSGMGLGAGDLMLWPEPSGFSRQEVVHNLRYLPGDTSLFRADYAYDNLLYIVAGQVIEAVSGKSWEAFVEQELMAPLGMQHCIAGHVPEHLKEFEAIPHKNVEGELAVVIREQGSGPLVSAPAGGIRCSLADMTRWMQMWLDDEAALISAKQKSLMWSPYTIMGIGSTAREYDRTHFAAYGLGWRLHDYHGYLRVHHTGALAGMRAHLSLFPELDLGVMVMLNKGSSDAREAIMQTITRAFVAGKQDIDWVDHYWQKQQARAARTQKKRATIDASFDLASANLHVDDYKGAYQDNWFGQVTIASEQGRLRWHSSKMVKLTGTMLAVSPDRFYIDWDDNSMHADVWTVFDRNEQGQIVGMKMEPFEDIDWSFDFQDLSFKKLTP